MSDQSKPTAHKLYDESAPHSRSREAIKFLTAVAIGAALLFLSGITLTGTVIVLVLATPILVLFSPILVPAGIVVFLATAGFMFSGGCGVAAITALSWIYNFVAGKQPPGAEKVDRARMKIASKARDMKERAKEYGQSVQNKAQEATQG